jgi:hypothetical protein
MVLELTLPCSKTKATVLDWYAQARTHQRGLQPGMVSTL